VLEILNEVLTSELTAINQYFAHAKMCENWGLDRLAERFRNESIEEMKDAESLMDRILYLEGVPNMQRLGSVVLGETVPEQLELGLQLEQASIERYNRAISVCVTAGDNGSREMFERQLLGEEEHAEWLASQLELIRLIGVENYLAQQIHD
jgi:bacterioferritin